MRSRGLAIGVSLLALTLAGSARARPSIRSDFFARYTGAVNTQLDDLPSNPGHCGVCHYDFDGSGTRNFYGEAVKQRRDQGMTNDQAFAALEVLDSDGDGHSNLIEITSTLYSNTPTFRASPRPTRA